MPDQYLQPLPNINVTSVFGQSRPGETHKGVDLGAAAGTPITNMADGTVQSVTTGYGGGFGNSVVMDYGDGVTARFAHMQSIPQTVDANGKLIPLVPGAKVGAGSVLGNVGSTGRSTGPHLHLQMAQDGVPFNPMDALYNKVSPPSPQNTATVDQTTRQTGSQGSPSPSIKNPGPNVVKAAGLGQIARDKDTDIGFVTEFDSEVDPHFAYYAAAEIKIGDTVICPFAPDPVPTPPGELSEQTDDETQGYLNDLRLEEFQYRSQVAGGGNTALARMFLKSWSDVVQIMALAAEKDIADVRFGYLNIPDGIVGPYKFKIVYITPEFLDNGYSISIEMFEQAAFENINAGNKTASWQAESGRVSDIVKYIANQNGWRTCIEPTVAGDPFHTYTQRQQSDLNFMNTELASKARSAEARGEQIKTENGIGYGPYVAYIHPAGPNDSDKSPILHFHPLLPAMHNTQAATPVREYVWGGLQKPEIRKFGTVISFNPSFENTAFSILGGANFKVASVDVTKKLMQTVVAYGSDFDDRQIGQNVGPVSVNMSNDTPTRSEARHEHDLEFLKSQAGARFFQLRQFALSASMSVLGDPYVRGGIMINVLVVRPNDGSIMMYDWYVVEAIHTIAGGEYSINFNLNRSLAGPISTPEDASLPGLGVGAGLHYTQQTFIKSLSEGIAVGANSGSPQ